MHVGINTLFLIPGEVGGSEIYLRETLRAIAEHHPDVRLTLFTNIENDAALRDLLEPHEQVGFQQLRFHATNRYARIIREQTELPRRVLAAGCDVLWSPGYTAALRARCPQVLTIHDMQYKRFPEDLTWLARLTTHILVQRGVRRCAAALTPSEFARQEIIRFTGARSDAVHVTPEAADAAFADGGGLSPSSDAVRDILESGTPYILSVGHSYPHKNLHALVEAFDRVAGDRAERLVIVGKARLGEPLLQSALEQSAHRDRITRLHGLPFEDLVLLYRNATAFIFPSLYEGFGLPVLEAMAAGAPVLAAHEASVPEVGGDTIAYFDPGTPRGLETQLRQLLDVAPAERDETVRRARDRAQLFSWEKTAYATMAVLRAVHAERTDREE